MASGTGKTSLALWVLQRLYERESRIDVVVFAPTLELLVQLAKEWSLCLVSEVSQPKFLMLRSPYKTSAGDDNLYAKIPREVQMTADIRQLERFLENDSMRVLFSTYQNAHKIQEVHARISHSFSFGLFDEVHRAEFKASQSSARMAIKDESIRITRRLFMTVPGELSHVDLFGDVCFTYLAS